MGTTLPAVEVPPLKRPTIIRLRWVLIGSSIHVEPLARQQVGMFDADLESFGEDLDLSLRARRLGFKLHYVHDAKILHSLGQLRKGRREKYTWSNETACVQPLEVAGGVMRPARMDWTPIASMGLSAGMGRALGRAPG